MDNYHSLLSRDHGGPEFSLPWAASTENGLLYLSYTDRMGV